MNSLNITARIELDLSLRLREQFTKELATLPEGYLAKTKSRNNVYMRWKYSGGFKHLSNSNDNDMLIAKKLRRKRFLTETLKVLNNNIKVLQKLLKDYIPADPLDIMNSLSGVYKLPPGREKEVPEGFVPQRAEDCDFKSKSEQIIALVLEANNIEYMYEWGHMLDGIVYRPDFTLRLPGTGEFIVYEHFGMIDHPGYYEKMIKKLIDYWHAGIRLGENLIVTFETKDAPLTANNVQATLNTMLKKED